MVYNPCNKTDQILYDGKNNEGACDCVDDERQLIYFQGECHIQNVQVILNATQVKIAFIITLFSGRDLVSMDRGWF